MTKRIAIIGHTPPAVLEYSTTIDLRCLLRSPHDSVTIDWECGLASGSTTCEAWRGQHEIDGMLRAGYKIVGIHAGGHRFTRREPYIEHDHYAGREGG